MKTFGQLIESTNELTESKSSFKTNHEKWNEIGHLKTFDNMNDCTVETAKKPLKVYDVVSHKKSWKDWDPNHSGHGVPHTKYFDRTYHTLSDEVGRKVGTHDHMEMTIPKGTKILKDHEHGDYYTSHPKHGFVRGSFDPEDDEVNK
jgi:hypothetical protein